MGEFLQGHNHSAHHITDLFIVSLSLHPLVPGLNEMCSVLPERAVLRARFKGHVEILYLSTVLGPS